MPKIKYRSVDECIDRQPKETQPKLRRVRTIIRRTIPDAEEGIAYQIPVYKLSGKNVIYFAGWKEHFSLYPIGDLVAETLSEELAEYELGKGTIRFPYSARLPTHLIARIAELRSQEVLAAAKPKRTASPGKKRPRSKPR